MNNIKYENYEVTTSKIEEDSESDSSKSSDNSSEENSSTSSNQDQEKSQNSESESNQTQNKYTLQKTSTLSNTDNNVDWSKIKNEVENMYSSVPTITLDLYSQNINQNEILDFNNELDNLTVSAKEENKENTLIHLSNLYGYLPKYLDNVSTDKTYINLIKTKANIVNAYSIIDTDDWNKVLEYINLAIESYSNLLNNLSDDLKTYSINKGYIILNEMKNAVNLKDREIFLIKYKNLLEEFNSI
jgi:hypothetical protein